ncbi:hypothetical protein HYPSUDRAFT_56730 [Hypholoma sublateritium FD-334 SS-4]|uniref:Transmembrane protein n=1 Tax=Hypholoma sublateritium (strain FD-334 SS-4) TaxID=945553 RepID=A0A0D2M7L6_HYPSF|nr:hypothetical protein HYPSUDRAFT_56730 [Hypholoma sublateritium FD-334 SS-4]
MSEHPESMLVAKSFWVASRVASKMPIAPMQLPRVPPAFSRSPFRAIVCIAGRPMSVDDEEKKWQKQTGAVQHVPAICSSVQSISGSNRTLQAGQRRARHYRRFISSPPSLPRAVCPPRCSRTSKPVLMAGLRAALSVVIVSHLAALSISIFRIVDRLRRNRLWYDDAFTAVAAIGSFLTMGSLLEMVFKTPFIKPLEYRIIFASNFFVIWASKACFVMTMGRVLDSSYWPTLVPWFLSMSSFLVGIGITCTVLALFLCKVDSTCSNNTTCYCDVSTNLLLSALISNVIIDTAIIGLSARIYMLKMLKTHLARKWIVKNAVISSIAILVVDVALWPSYRAFTSNRYIILFFLINVVAIVSGIFSNIPAIIGILSGNFSLTGGVVDSPNEYFDDSSRRTGGEDGEHLALRSVPLSNTSEDTFPQRTASLSEDVVVNISANTITITLTAPSTRSLSPPPDCNSTVYAATAPKTTKL